MTDIPRYPVSDESRIRPPFDSFSLCSNSLRAGTSPMRVALVHELLTMKGGAEHVLRVMADMFPDAPVYTFLYNEKKLGDWFPKERVHTPVSGMLKAANSQFSILNSQFFNHHLYLPYFPAAAEAWDFSGFDLVISSSSAFAHGIITNGKPKHISYINSPARYLWDRAHDVQSRSNPLSRAYLSWISHRLRVWDAEAARRADMLLCSSREVQRRIQLYWDRPSDVLYPPIADHWLEPDSLHVTRYTSEQGNVQRANAPTRNNFLIVSTLAPYKRIDLAVDACTRLNLPLTVIGEGPAKADLQRRAGPTVRFLGYQPAEKVKEHYASARALIFPGHEDFGLVPVEAMSQGVPVVAYRRGGALETVKEGETGTFFGALTVDAIAETLGTFDHKKYSKEKCMNRAKEFSRSAFVQQLYSKIDTVMKN